MLQPGARALLVQVAVGLTVASCALSSGMSLGFSAVADKLLSQAPDFLSKEQISWFASVASVSTPLGCLTAGPLLDAFGRRVALLSLNVPFLLGWVLLATAGDGVVAQMYVGRLLTGFATGMAAVPATVYLGEMAVARVRGVFVTWTSLAIAVGILLVYLVGAATKPQWRWAAWACALVPLLATPLVALLVPESPVWLAQRGRADDAERSLRRLRGLGRKTPLPPDVVAELSALPPPPLAAPAAAPSGLSARLRNGLRTLARPEAWKPLLIMNGFFLFQQITGIYVVVAYAVRFVEEAGVALDAYVASVLLAGVQVLGGAGASAVLSRWGRRPLSLVAGVAQTLPLAALGLYLHLGASGADWLPLTTLLLYVLAGSFGLHTLPWAMLGEVFPARVRGVAAGLTTCLAYLYNFAMLKAYPSLASACQAGSARGSSELLFYAFAVTSALSVLFVALCLPETHGRSAADIEALFARRATGDAEKLAGAPAPAAAAELALPPASPALP